MKLDFISSLRDVSPGEWPEIVIVRTGNETEPACFAFVSIDADLYAPTAAALPLFWERLSPGGALMIHDVYSTQFGGVRHAVDEFCAENDLLPMPVCDLHGSAVIRKPIKNEHK